MDITPTAILTSNTNINTSTPSAKSPDPDTETPIRIQPTTTIKSSPFTNGVLKRHNSHHHHNHRLSSPPPLYKECLKNHAASLGGHALDGCGEFMPSPTAVHTNPTSLKCAACGCHRNFHRREPEDSPSYNLPANATIEYQPHHRHHPPPPPPIPLQQPPPSGHHQPRSPNSASPPPISSSYYPSAPHMLLALSGGLNDNANINLQAAAAAAAAAAAGSSPRKRFRTKFSQTQKEKMYQFAERVGWKMQKKDEELMREFCNEIGVDKGVLKVWMHNNKNTVSAAKRDGNGINGGINSNNDNDNDNNTNHHSNAINLGISEGSNSNNKNGIPDHHGVHVGTNGSSSSS